MRFIIGGMTLPTNPNVDPGVYSPPSGRVIMTGALLLVGLAAITCGALALYQGGPTFLGAHHLVEMGSAGGWSLVLFGATTVAGSLVIYKINFRPIHPPVDLLVKSKADFPYPIMIHCVDAKEHVESLIQECKEDIPKVFEFLETCVRAGISPVIDASEKKYLMWDPCPQAEGASAYIFVFQYASDRKAVDIFATRRLPDEEEALNQPTGNDRKDESPKARENETKYFTFLDSLEDKGYNLKNKGHNKDRNRSLPRHKNQISVIQRHL